MISLAHEAETPAGNPVAVPILVAPDVACVMEVNGVFTNNVGVELEVSTVFAGITVIVPVAFTEPQPPVNGIL